MRYFEDDTCPSCYVCHTIEFLRAIRRVLRPDGVVLWNVGDSYASSPPGNKNKGDRYEGHWHTGGTKTFVGDEQLRSTVVSGLKPKDLCLIPFRVALAAQADGWWVRSAIIWAKTNPMPESVTDRPTDAYEHIFMLTKSARYYWDQEAVREVSITFDRESSRQPHIFGGENKGKILRENGIRTSGAEYTPHPNRNLRNVWTISTQPYPEAHFATFPSEIPKRCILAATSEKGNCSECGKPWVRIVERHETLEHKPYEGGKSFGEDDQHPYKRISGNVRAWREAGGDHDNPFPSPKTLGWKAQCSCNAPTTPAIVLDPFSGSGTTGEEAKKQGRKAILIDISEEYCELAVKRIERIPIPMSL